MSIACGLLVLQGAIGAFDTLYYHEWLARLPARGRHSAPELYLHAARSMLYAVLFGSLAWVAWHGAWLFALAAVIVAEIALTLWDFVVEIRVRKLLGDVYAGERVTHAVMGILYGAMLAFLSPTLAAWRAEPTALVVGAAPLPDWMIWALSAMAVGVLASGLRDLYAALGGPGGSWPWQKIEE
jgi:hypothetical protein